VSVLAGVIPRRSYHFVIAVWSAKGNTIRRGEVLGNNRRQSQQTGWSWGCVATVDCEGRTIWVVAADRASLCTPMKSRLAKIPVISPLRAILPAQLGRDCPEIGEDGIDQLDGKHLSFCGFQRRCHCLQGLVERFSHDLNRDALFS
jgi:hypothetical protein